MSEPRSQSTYQIRLAWGAEGLARLAPAGIVVIVDVLGSPEKLAADAAAGENGPTVFLGTLRNATATAQAVYDEHVSRGGRNAINLVLAGDDGDFAVEDYLA